MNKIKHNKKRNVGLVFEQLNRVMAKSIIEGDTEKANKCSEIIKEHFSSGTELHKELRLFLALSTIRVNNDSLIDKIMREAKEASSNVDVSKLSREKTRLINSLNESFGKDFIFSEKVDAFKSLATVQVLLNEWRKPTTAAYSYKLEDQLITEMKGKTTHSEPKREIPQVNKVVLEMAKKRFFDKYKGLSAVQLEMLFEHVSTSESQREPLTRKYESMRQRAAVGIKQYLESEGKKQSDYFVQKLTEARVKIDSFEFNGSLPPETRIARALTIQKLLEELINE